MLSTARKELEAKWKSELKDDFRKHNCLALWVEWYDTDITTFSQVIDDCIKRADGMLVNDSSDTEAMQAFVNMVNSWT